jgi:hypothetical protein
MEFFLRKKSAISSSMSAANSEGQPGGEKQEETKASNDKEEKKERDTEAGKGSNEEEVVSDSKESKGTTTRTLQDFQLKDGSNMGPNLPTGRRVHARTSDVWTSILQLKGDLTKSELGVDKMHICKHNTKLHVRPCSGRNSFQICHGPRKKLNFHSSFGMWIWAVS